MVFMLDPEPGIEEISNEIPVQHLIEISGLTVINASRAELKEIDNEKPANFEEAIAATNFGKFNIALFFCAVPAFLSAVSVTTSVSYVFTKVKCNTSESIMDMGTINAITYGGMISSSLIWSYLSDTLGRKRIMLLGFLATGAVDLIPAFSQNFDVLLVTRFIAGGLLIGQLAVLVSYTAELHGAGRRSTVLLYCFLFYSASNTGLALIAWAMMADDWYFEIFGGIFVLRSHHVFMTTFAAMPLVAAVAFTLMPESPEFLMSKGRNEEALWIFQRMYALNNNKNPEDYPIRKLVGWRKDLSRGDADLQGISEQTRALFSLSRLKWLVLVCFIHIGAMFGSNTLRLWFPHLAAVFENKSDGICTSISVHTQPPPLLSEELETCVPIHVDTTTYTQSAAVCMASLLMCSLAGLLVDKCGRRVVAGGCMLISATTCAFLPVLGSTFAAVSTIVAIFMAFAELASGVLNSSVVDLFPTSRRVVAVAGFLMLGRLGTLSGNLVIPALLALGCLPPFLLITFVMAVGGLLCFLMPNTAFKSLE